MENALRMADWNTNKPLCVGLEIEELKLELTRLNEGSLFLSYPLTKGKVRREIRGKLKRRGAVVRSTLHSTSFPETSKATEMCKQVITTLAHFNKTQS